MADTTAHLALPFIMASQAQKHVTHNEALRLLDGIVQLSVLDRDLTAPPGSPAEGARYIPASGATGAWAGWDGNVAYWVDGAWMKLTPVPGWLCWVEDEGALLGWSGAAWQPVGGGSGGDAAFNTLGVGGAAGDATNRLSVNSPATLLNNAGAGHQVKVNKNAAGDTASLLFQSNWTGFAEMGLAGDNLFSIKVSNGTSWTESLKFTAQGLINRAASAIVASNALEEKSGALLMQGDFGLGTRNVPLLSNLDAINTVPTGYYYLHGTNTSGTWPVAANAGMFFSIQFSGAWTTQFMTYRGDASPTYRGRMFMRQTQSPSEWRPWIEFLTTNNTTVDSNGFVKSASPIIRLFRDHIEEPCQPTGAVLTRESVGIYTLTETLGLAQDGWQIEVPKDHNGNRLCFVQTEWDYVEQMLTILVSEPVWLEGRWIAGDPIDIPHGRWIDIRLHEDPESELTEAQTEANP